MNKKVVGIIPLYGKNEYFEELLESISKQTYPFHRIIVIDNKGEGEDLCRRYDFVYYIKMPFNMGYAAGVNKGIIIAKDFSPDYIAILNDDVVLDKNWLENGIMAMKEDSDIWAITGKIILYDKRHLLNSAGVVINNEGYGYDRGFSKHFEIKYDKYVLAPSGAGMILKQDTIEKVGLFDISLQAYYEDTDYGIRIWNKGGKVGYIDTMVMYHRFSASSERRWKEWQMRRNRLYILLKHFSFGKYLSALFKEILMPFKDKRFLFHLSLSFSSLLMIAECLPKMERKKRWLHLIDEEGLSIDEDFYDYASVYVDTPKKIPSSIIVGYNDKIIGTGWTPVRLNKYGGYIRFVKDKKAVLFSSCKKCKLILYLDKNSELIIKNGDNTFNVKGEGYKECLFESRCDRIDMELVKGKAGFVSLLFIKIK